MENNVSSYTIDASQGAFLAGMAAAATGACKIAFLGSVNEAWMMNNALSFVAGAIFLEPEFNNPLKYEYDFVGKATDEVTARAKNERSIRKWRRPGFCQYPRLKRRRLRLGKAI